MSRNDKMGDVKDKYMAAMVLGGVGDALGYKNGKWEFCLSGQTIHREVRELGGLSTIKVKPPNWILSDDTVMHLATADALIKHGKADDKSQLYALLAEEYVYSMADMTNRGPGQMCMRSCQLLKENMNQLPNQPGSYKIPFSENAGGCGAAMRAMCIGLRYPHEEDIGHLIEVSIESGRMTHHHPSGYLGSLAAALFTSYAIQKKPLVRWGADLMSVLHHAKHYVCSQTDHFPVENAVTWDYFVTRWTDFLHSRNIVDGMNEPYFPADYDVDFRDKTYQFRSFSGWGGSSGHDAPMIAYEAILASGDNWEELCNRAMFHGGDNDSTGIIAGCLFGAMYGTTGVPENNYTNVEYRKRLEDRAQQLYSLAF